MILVFFHELNQYGIRRYRRYSNTVPQDQIITSFYLLMVGKKDDFEIVVVGRGVVIRGIDSVVEVVDDVPVVVRVVVMVKSGILGAL